MPLPKEEFKVFISHATEEDGALVEWIADALDRLHIRAFVYERYPRGGQNRFDTIKGMIEVCPYFLVVLTKAGIASQWVNQEIGYAVAVGREPIPVREVDSATGKLINSKGFVELNDPIYYYRNNDVRLMADIIYTFHSLLLPAKKWTDFIYVRCKCGNEFEGELGFDENWEQWLERPREELPQWGLWVAEPSIKQGPITVGWPCSKCGREVRISFPDCHLLPQEY
jgi:hypothetical protein